MTLDDSMIEACRAVQIEPPRKTPEPGRWCQTRVEGKARSNKSGRVLVFDDMQGGICWNWATGQQERFSLRGNGQAAPAPRSRPDPEKVRRREAERQEVARICQVIVGACETTEHPYLARKGFLEERGLVIERAALPPMTEAMKRALPEGEGPLLVVPGRIGKSLTTVQLITADGIKKNILGGAMGGAAHRIATGRETWVCEGIATALTIRAALRLLGRSATVLSAFSAANVGQIASGMAGAVVAADHDKPLEQFGGLGTGEHYARQSGRRWAMPPEMGDWNDHHQEHGLRSVALALREIPP